MAKIPDLSKLTEKLDIQGLVNKAKSMISPGSEILDDAEGGDPVAIRLAALLALIHHISEVHAQQGKEIAKLNDTINALYHDLKPKEEAKPSGTAESKPEEKQAEAPAEPEVKHTEAPAEPAEPHAKPNENEPKE